MSNKITVYWTCLDKEWLRAKEPTLIYNKILERSSTKTIRLPQCPGFKDYTTNLFGLHSLYDYELKIIENSQVVSNIYDQEFFNSHVVIRSAEDKCLSFAQTFLFFTEENILKLSVGIQPFFEENLISERCMVIPGTYDIGKWFRPLDFAFYLKKDYDCFEIKENDIFQYIKFHTDKKIVFKQFYMDEFLDRQYLAVGNAKSNRNDNFRKLKSYYDMFKHKDKVIRAIKNNLID